MDTKIKQQEIQKEISMLKIKANLSERIGIITLKVLVSLFAFSIIATILSERIEFSKKGVLELPLIIFFIGGIPIIYAAFLRQKQNLLFKELELLIKHQIELP